MKKFILEALEDSDLPVEEPTEKIESGSEETAVPEDTEEDIEDSIYPEDIELTDEQKNSFEITTVCELLKQNLDQYSQISTILSSDEESTNISEKIRAILESVLEDVSVIVGKLQQSLKEVATPKQSETIESGEEEISKDVEEKTEENKEETEEEK